MLGKDHIYLTFLTFVPFVIPLLFIKIDFSYALLFLFTLVIGSLLPDSDCNGKATIYYKYKIFYIFMKKIVIGFVIFVFQNLISKKYNLMYEVKEEHRGIMHSPMGIIINSVLITLVLGLIFLIIEVFNWILLLTIFLGLTMGQFMHLLEDSCTVSGINWKFPFNSFVIKGEISTFPKDNKKDVRPIIFEIWLGLFSFFLLVLYMHYSLKFPIVFVYLILFFIVSAFWILFLYLSKQKTNYSINVELFNKIFRKKRIRYYKKEKYY